MQAVTTNRSRHCKSAPTSLPGRHFGATDLDRRNPRLDCAMRAIAMTHDAVAAIRQSQVLPHGDKGIAFHGSH
jgi:hypothetical protein